MAAPTGAAELSAQVHPNLHLRTATPMMLPLVRRSTGLHAVACCAEISIAAAYSLSGSPPSCTFVGGGALASSFPETSLLTGVLGSVDPSVSAEPSGVALSVSA